MIQKRHIYADAISEERHTGVTKKKYKLAGSWPESLRSQNIRLFFISSSKSYNMGKDTGVKIDRDDYEICSLKQLSEKTSYYDVTKSEVLSNKEILQKMRDPRNKFKDVATIKEASFKKFLEAANGLRVRARPPISVQNIIDINKSIIDEEFSEARLKKLGLI